MSIPRGLTVFVTSNDTITYNKIRVSGEIGLANSNGLTLVRICLYFIEIEPVYQYVAFTLHQCHQML